MQQIPVCFVLKNTSAQGYDIVLQAIYYHCMERDDIVLLLHKYDGCEAVMIGRTEVQMED